MTVFDTKQRTYRHRSELHVLLRLSGDAAPVEATLFASLGERASDLLNDTRAFIPVRLANGETMIVAKSQIASLVEDQNPSAGASEDVPKSKFYGEDFSSAPKQPGKAEKTFDAYATLRVSPSASNEEIRAAYKARMKAVHPDALASLGLDEDLAKAAVLATQKVNYAYNKIMRDRETATNVTA